MNFFEINYTEQGLELESNETLILFKEDNMYFEQVEKLLLEIDYPLGKAMREFNFDGQSDDVQGRLIAYVDYCDEDTYKLELV